MSDRVLSILMIRVRIRIRVMIERMPPATCPFGSGPDRTWLRREKVGWVDAIAREGVAHLRKFLRYDRDGQANDDASVVSAAGAIAFRSHWPG